MDRRRFRFAVQLTGPAAGKSWAETARHAEDLGYSTLLIPDHFNDQLASVPALMAAADATKNLRVGALVWAVDYRHPVVLAKEAATIDVLSGGRLEFGLGAGWMSADYLQAGISEDSPGTRIERLEETVAICRGFWRGEVFSFRGKHFQITDLVGVPKPTQQPHPPVLIGGGGKRVLTVAAKNADIVGINPKLGSEARVTFEAFSQSAVDEKVAHVRSSAGERFKSIELSVITTRIQVGNGWQERRRLVANAFGCMPEALDASPYIWIGDEERVIEHIHEIRERWGISYFALHGSDAMEQAAVVVTRLSGH